MGSIWTQQGCLRIGKEQGLVEKDQLEIGKEYPFRKEKHRLYMIGVPMDLISKDWQAIAKIIVIEYTIGHNETRGIYKVLKIYSDEESAVISRTLIPYEEITNN